MTRFARLLALAMTLAAAPGLAADAPLRPERLREAMGLKLGSWHSTVTVADVQVEPTPGADPAEAEQAVAALRPQIGLSQANEECLWDSPELLFIPGLRVESGCDFSRIEARGGRFAVAGRCVRPNAGVRMEMAMEGSYTSETMASHFDVTTTSGQVRIRIKANARSRFAGPCPAPPVIVTPR